MLGRCSAADSATVLLWTGADPTALGQPDPWRLGSTGFPAGSQEISVSWRRLNQPFRQTQQQPADLSLLVVSPVSKIRLLQRVVSCCLGVFILQFPPLSLFFSVSHKVRIPSLWRNESPNKGCFFHTDPIPTELVFFYRIYRSCSWLFLLRS